MGQILAVVYYAYTLTNIVLQRDSTRLCLKTRRTMNWVNCFQYNCTNDFHMNLLVQR